MRSVLQLMDVHAGLDETFAVHRDYVVGLEFAKALEVLESFERDLRAHMEIEERFVLPLYSERVGKVTWSTGTSSATWRPPKTPFDGWPPIPGRAVARPTSSSIRSGCSAT